MAAEFVNRAQKNMNIGAQIGQSLGPVNVVVGGNLNQTSAEAPDRQHLFEQLEELRLAITAAQSRAELTTKAGDLALYELETACEEVDTALSGDSRGLLASLKRLTKPLGGALDLLAKVAAIVTAVQGLR